MTVVRKARRVTAKELHECFAQVIKRRSVPGIDLCAELAEQINQYVPAFDAMHATRGGFPAYWHNAVLKAMRDGRRFMHSLQRIPVIENLLVPRPTFVDEIQAVLAKFLKQNGRRRRRDTKSEIWTLCAEEFTPHIVDTLRRAGWRKVSTTDKDSAVIAVLSELIGALTGDMPPDKASLGSTLRQAKTRKEKGRK
jgi:hypothetical protein